MRILVALLLLTGVAQARPFIAYDDEEERPKGWRNDRAFAEWSTWIRLGYGAASEPRDVAARTATPIASHEIGGDWDAGLGGDVTFPLPTSKVRMGPWLELRADLDDPIAGGVEVSIAGKSLDMFFYEGERTLIVRAGAGMSRVTAAIAYGYRCPWKLWGPYHDSSRYMIGVRLVAAGSRAANDSNDWNVSFGIEFEPVGSLRYLGGIRSWY